MKLQYILSVPATSTAAITLPFGVAQVKMRGSVSMPITGIGQISNVGINQCTSIKVPYHRRKKPLHIFGLQQRSQCGKFLLVCRGIGGYTRLRLLHGRCRK